MRFSRYLTLLLLGSLILASKAQDGDEDEEEDEGRLLDKCHDCIITNIVIT